MSKLNIEYETRFSTDVATIAIFDPMTFDIHKDDEGDWWTGSLEDIKEVQDGKAAVISMGCDGTYVVRLTSEDLTELERRNAIDVLDNIGVEVSSGKLYIGDGVNIPGGGFNDCIEKSINFPNGIYRLTAYAINQPDDEAIPDIVVILKQRNQNEYVEISEMRLEWAKDEYLFVEKTKPKLGKKLSGKVWQTNRTECGLIIKDSEYTWPASHDDYDAILEDMAQLQRGDKVQMKTIDIDEKNKLLICELIKRIPKE